MVNRPNQENSESNELSDNGDIDLLTPVEDQKTAVEKEGVQRDEDAVDSLMLLPEGDDNSQHIVEEDNHQEEYGVVDQNKTWHEEVGLDQVPLLEDLGSQQVAEGDFPVLDLIPFVSDNLAILLLCW